MAKKPFKKRSNREDSGQSRRAKPPRKTARPDHKSPRSGPDRRNSQTQQAKKPSVPLRTETGGEIIYGKHSVKAVFLKRPQDVEKLLIAGKPEYHADVIALAEKNRVDSYLLDWSDFQTEGGFGEDDKHQGIMAVVKPRQIFLESELHQLDKARCVLVLDQVSNPQNLATIIRSAAFFGADALLYMKNRAATPTAEVVRFAVGGAEMIDMYQITNVAQSLNALKDLGFTVLGMDERGERTLAQHDLSSKVAFVIGAEGEGLRNKTRQYCTDLVRIPGGLEGVESLNAAVATTIALYEFARLMPQDSN